ncbi:MAG: beta-N-acetylhexosaminidase [Planctomycetota bacterium]|nr:beta-N-acetylhexosaminidase [Planctomycetota bacterium]
MPRLNVDLKNCPEELRGGLDVILADFPDRFGGRGAVGLSFVRDDSLAAGGFKAEVAKGAITVRYGGKTDAFRALGRIMGGHCKGGAFSETPRFKTLGVMVDVSRNGVIRPDVAKTLMRRIALMGLNMMILYAEDTYEVPGEPFFGYLRGRLTADEMRDLDRYADMFGIEMFPCIQALAHLEQILQWPAYYQYRDTDHVMLAGWDRTCALLEKMIEAASAPFRSKRIHVGMDEAHGIGSGRYRKLFGEKRPFDILNDHLLKVRDICLRRGLKPMIWSDMYFRLGSKRNDYYDRECVIPPDVIEKIPKDVQLVYWDYYHADPEFYADWIERHRALGSEPIVAGGAWTWNRFWAAIPSAMAATDACMKACKRKGVREAFITLWGDDGMECDVFSALPVVQFFAEHGWSGDGDVDGEAMRANFRGSCGADFDDFVAASGLDMIPQIREPAKCRSNAGKWILWQDPLLAIFDPQIEISPRAHYSALARKLEGASKKKGLPMNRRLTFPAAAARALSLKCDLRKNLAGACARNDRRTLKKILDGDLKALRAAVDALWKEHRQMWLETYKPFGLEVIELRYGGLRTRLESLEMRLKAYLKGDLDAIPELAEKLERIHEWKDGPGMVGYGRACTPSFIR